LARGRTGARPLHGGCHKIGLKGEADVKQSSSSGQMHGNASCEACHTRHTFSVKEARQPQACQTCHMPGGNHEVRTAWGFLSVRLPMLSIAWASSAARP